jgi:hypothetical protein
VFNYSAYNLGISSALPLPEVQPSAEAAADVEIRLGEIEWVAPQGDYAENELCFEITPGNAPGTDERVLRLPLLGTVMAVLLQQRGYFVLHASAVSIDGAAIIFLGNKGYGKSTMAATLYGRGHQLVADDIVALTFDTGRFMVVPGFPHFKLYPEAVVASLGDDCSLLTELASGYEKRGRPVTDRFAREAMPLKGIYVLGIGPVESIKKLDRQQALLTVIANSYAARFGNHLLRGNTASSHLKQCAKLIVEHPIYRLERPDSLELLPAVARIVEQQSSQAAVLS